jgi:hypothetical protein
MIQLLHYINTILQIFIQMSNNLYGLCHLIIEKKNNKQKIKTINVHVYIVRCCYRVLQEKNEVYDIS